MSRSFDARTVRSMVATDTHENRRGRDRLAELYSMHASEGLRFAILLTGDRQAGEDLVHDAFIRISGRFGDRKEPRVFDQYLRATILNLARSQARKARRQGVIMSLFRAQVAKDDLADADSRDAVWRVLLRLPLRQRTAIFLRYYLDLSEEQAAAEMSCSLSAFKSLMLRASKKLSTELER